MAIERRDTIQMSDIVAIEFECKQLTDEITVPGRCGMQGCVGILWFTDGSNEHQELQMLLRLLARLRSFGANKPFNLKLEIAGLGSTQ